MQGNFFLIFKKIFESFLKIILGKIKFENGQAKTIIQFDFPAKEHGFYYFEAINKLSYLIYNYIT